MLATEYYLFIDNNKTHTMFSLYVRLVRNRQADRQTGKGRKCELSKKQTLRHRKCALGKKQSDT